ncbi:MAG: class I SAM-dependent methyltransferase [Mesotoga sp.]|nr:class I SAM-dependent methyltransferase [Mesotoga sp.]
MAAFAESLPSSQRVLDVGSMDVNGSYKPLFQDHDYQGLDIAPGPNVDIVAPDPYDWPIEDNSFDVVISGQCLEHVEYPWRTVEEIARVLKPGGMCCIIAPSNGPEHRYPIDCYRYMPDGMKAMAKDAGLKVVSSSLHDPGINIKAFLWYLSKGKINTFRVIDCIMIAKKQIEE